MINSIIKIVLGVKISQKNFNPEGIIAVIVVIGFGYAISEWADFFGIIDNLLTIIERPWYSFYFATFSFLMIFVKISALSLFSKKKNLLNRFVAAFITQFLGFFFMVVAYTIFNSVENLIEDPQWKAAASLSPYVISILTFIAIRIIYEKKTFSAKRFFKM